MNYELAKELKDAGFSQEDRHWYYSLDTIPETLWCYNVLEPIILPDTKLVAAPTIEELIEECGIPFRELKRHTHGWSSSSARQAGGIQRKGRNPTEAVARLWLALNKKV